jgi:hypothetical protein
VASGVDGHTHPHPPYQSESDHDMISITDFKQDAVLGMSS